ncbi:MAG: N-acetyl sugar amidotransferase [Fimbriimonadaceae bacterium]|nr:N-acetyl sugar amidotransferase [Fimbriimonadaceae bacterium]
MITVPKRFVPAEYRQCSLTVLDNIQDPAITFDRDGVCNYCHLYAKREANEVFKGKEGRRKLEALLKQMKKDGKGRKYDAILGVSGGVDSTYLAYLAAQWDLRVLCVHFDNGWNSELAVSNIENVVSRLGFDLHTHVFDWEEFKDLQLSHFKANVVDIEAITDLGIVGTLRMLALQKNVKYMLSGLNIVTEGIMVRNWVFKDYYNIIDIHKKFGTLKKIATFPYYDNNLHRMRARLRGIEDVTPLDYVPYIKREAKELIKNELGWRDYGGKHYESVFTRFYQGYILPEKFGIDKRKVHLSTLIMSGQMTKKEALEELQRPIMSDEQFNVDYPFVIKKLGYTEKKFEKYIEAPRVEHTEFETETSVLKRSRVISALKSIGRRR